eukprot:1718746-Prymnesium_polylepis.1
MAQRWCGTEHQQGPSASRDRAPAGTERQQGPSAACAHLARERVVDAFAGARGGEGGLAESEVGDGLGAHVCGE